MNYSCRTLWKQKDQLAWMSFLYNTYILFYSVLLYFEISFVCIIITKIKKYCFPLRGIVFSTSAISTSTTWYISQLMRLRVMHNISNVFFCFFLMKSSGGKIIKLLKFLWLFLIEIISRESLWLESCYNYSFYKAIFPYLSL